MKVAIINIYILKNMFYKFKDEYHLFRSKLQILFYK